MLSTSHTHNEIYWSVSHSNSESEAVNLTNKIRYNFGRASDSKRPHFCLSVIQDKVFRGVVQENKYNKLFSITTNMCDEYESIENIKLSEANSQAQPNLIKPNLFNQI